MSAMLDLNTIGAASWRAGNEIFDCRSHLRILENELIDVVFVTNMRDEVDRKRFLGKFQPKEGHFSGPRYWVNGVAGRTRALNVTSEDLTTEQGRILAKKYFISAVEWARTRGAKVCLLAAGTKHLFDDPINGDGYELKQKFPEMIFTIGDNGTMFLLLQEVFRALKRAGLGFKSRIVVLGPYGLLGEVVTRILLEKGYTNVIGAGPNSEKLFAIRDKYGINVFPDFERMGKVDAVVACTHSEKILLTADAVDKIRRNDRKLLVVDVAEPSNLKRRVWKKIKKYVVRQDAGNAFNDKLSYVLGPFSYKLFRLSRGVTFGCFAESLAIMLAIKRGEDENKFREMDLFVVSDANMEMAKRIFACEGFTVPSPRNFSKKVKSFDLKIKKKYFSFSYFSYEGVRELATAIKSIIL